jgi:hypothetical protein
VATNQSKPTAQNLGEKADGFELPLNKTSESKPVPDEGKPRRYNGLERFGETVLLYRVLSID